MSFDSFSLIGDSLIAPASRAFAIVPDDAADLPYATKAIYVGSSGDLVLRAIDSVDNVVLRNVVGGSILAIRTAAVRADGTTAGDIVGLV